MSKKRHLGKVNIVFNKEKRKIDLIKATKQFLNNDPKSKEMIDRLGNIADSMSNTQKLLNEKKYDSIDLWLAYSLSIMSPSLLAETEKNGFQKELQELVIKYLPLEETENDKLEIQS